MVSEIFFKNTSISHIVAVSDMFFVYHEDTHTVVVIEVEYFTKSHIDCPTAPIFTRAPNAD